MIKFGLVCKMNGFYRTIEVLLIQLSVCLCAQTFVFLIFLLCVVMWLVQKKLNIKRPIHFEHMAHQHQEEETGPTA